MTRQQFITYVESNQQQLRRFLTALCCGDSALADDIAQDTFLKAYLALDSFREDCKFSSWIFRIAYNVFIDTRRAARCSEELSQASAVATGDSADSSFHYQHLYTALDKLSAKERTSLLLFYIQGYSIKEISGIVDASEEAVKQQLSRGRMHLKNLLEQ